MESVHVQFGILAYSNLEIEYKLDVFQFEIRIWRYSTLQMGALIVYFRPKIMSCQFTYLTNGNYIKCRTLYT